MILKKGTPVTLHSGSGKLDYIIYEDTKTIFLKETKKSIYFKEVDGKFGNIRGRFSKLEVNINKNPQNSLELVITKK